MCLENHFCSGNSCKICGDSLEEIEKEIIRQNRHIGSNKITDWFKQ